ncbi:MAG TPA: hypothetical protein VFA46_22960 [Actinomycetes bacterium]|nr:hypothetical protein [Actinomycetes bacterium]
MTRIRWPTGCAPWPTRPSALTAVHVPLFRSFPDIPTDTLYIARLLVHLLQTPDAPCPL